MLLLFEFYVMFVLKKKEIVTGHIRLPLVNFNANGHLDFSTGHCSTILSKMYQWLVAGPISCMSNDKIKGP